MFQTTNPLCCKWNQILFLKLPKVANFLRALPQAMQEREWRSEIFGSSIWLNQNERKNRLHEIVRKLSGINIAVGDEEKPLVIKVAFNSPKC